MLTFFRKFRKSFIDSSSTRKYLLYAIGEIALVVIGILIALQINNWNEWRKDRIQEKTLLQRLSDNLERNIATINAALKYIDQRTNSSELIFRLLEQEGEYVDSLDQHFALGILRGQLAPPISQNSYESIKNEGFEKLTNQELSENIISLFEEVYKEVEDWRIYTNDNAIQDQLLWYKYFRRHDGGFRPLDFNTLGQNDEYLSLMTSVSEFRKINYRNYESALDATKLTLQLVNKELEKE